jgi:hypothetical protein
MIATVALGAHLPVGGSRRIVLAAQPPTTRLARRISAAEHRMASERVR